ncbi:MAG: ABC transporter substrate-binding protein [bacterium]
MTKIATKLHFHSSVIILFYIWIFFNTGNSILEMKGILCSNIFDNFILNSGSTGFSPVLSGLRFLFFSTLLVFSFLLSNCSNENNDANKEQINYGGTLKIIYSDPIENLDPQKVIYDNEWYISNIVYEGLVGYTSNPDSLAPILAESWQKIDDGKTWIFKIRDGVTFHNDPCFPNSIGRIVTPNDILNMFYRICSPASECLIKEIFVQRIVGAQEYYSGKADKIAGIKIIDNKHIQIELTKPYVTFLKLLASPYTFIVPKEAVEYYGNSFSKHAVGTGAYRMTLWKEWQEIDFARNENYWCKDEHGDKLPYLDGIKIIFLSSGNLSITEFLKGENHLLYVDGAMYQNIKSESDFVKKYNVQPVQTGNSIRFFSFSMDKNTPLARNKELRQAIAKSYDRTFLTNDSLNKMTLANTLAPSYFLRNYNFKWYDYDLFEAGAFLKNYSAILSKQKIKIFSTLYSPDVLELEAALKKINLNVEAEINTMNYYKFIVKDRPDIFRVSMKPVYPDPEEYYYLFYSKSDKSINLPQYKNTIYDALFERSMFEQNPEERRKLFIQLEHILYEDVPAIYLSHVTESYYIFPKFVKNFRLNCSVPDYRFLWMSSQPDEK